MDNVLSIQNISASLRIGRKYYSVLKDVSFSLEQGSVLGIVGESGSGKSVLMKFIMQLMDPAISRIDEGRICLEGQEITRLSDREMTQLRGNRISMIFQEPMTSLNPVLTCGDQMSEALMAHAKMSHVEAMKQAEKMLELVGVSNAKARLSAYPHKLSGGMRQRVMIGMALLTSPAVLLADEPTTALDPTIQAQILAIIRDLQKQMNMAVLFVTHDLGVVSSLCQRVAVMYFGTIVEEADTEELFRAPLHPYTQGLLDAAPKLIENRELLSSIPGSVPPLYTPPSGCPFHARCSKALPVCAVEFPAET